MESKLVILLIGVFVAVSGVNACSDFVGWDDYIADWNNIHYQMAKTMFPFGEAYCDREVSEPERYIGFDPKIGFTIPFYGSQYRSLWVSPDGFVALDKKTTPDLVIYDFMERWPNPAFPNAGSKDPAFIAPFYAEADFRISGGEDPSRLSYRVLDPAKATMDRQRNIQEGMLSHLSDLVRLANVGADHFIATHGIMITWYAVTFKAGSCSNNPEDNCKRNTHQLAIVTDELSTYTVHNYYQVTWVGGAGSQKCDPYSGLASASYPDCFPAQTGFNAGDARGFTSLPYSNDDKISQLDTLSGSNVLGRWYYDVGGSSIRHGGCTNDTNLGSSGNWPLVVDPLGGPMFGGNVITVSGPCFSSGQDIECRFEDVKTPGIYTGNMMKAMCVAPMQYRIGYVELAVSVNGRNFYFQNNYLNEMQERLVSEGSEVSVVNFNNDWLNPSQLRLLWRHRNLTSNEQDRVSIKLIGYREDNTQPIWKELYTFEADYNNQGYYEFIPPSNLCEQQNEASTCLLFEVGAFRISVNEWSWNPQHPRSIWSSLVPLGWFTKSTLSAQHGTEWPSLRCEEWYMKDSQSPGWRSSLPLCPCLLWQAYVDFGRFLPDLNCNLDNSMESEYCVVHSGAKACFKALYVSTSGSSITCCYDNHNNLMYSGDSVAGSTAHRSSPSGRFPYGEASLVPTLSHWMHDLVPYFSCCMWQTDMQDCYYRYMPARPTQDCKYYEPPAHASAFGDPHFITFDGTKYTFNGRGEFYLLLAEDASVLGNDVTFRLQARMQQPPLMGWGQVKATYMTAIAMQMNSGPKVTVEVNTWSRQEHLAVRVDDQLLNFTFPYMYWQEFEDFIITTNDPHDQLTYSNFTITYRYGVGIQVAWKEDLLNVLVSVPPEFHSKTKGLFGIYNGNPEDDLTPRPSGSSPIPPIDTEIIHKSFGVTWFIQESETLFTYLYRSAQNHAWYKDVDFLPYYTPTFPPNNSVSETDVNALCGTLTSCRYDYMVAQSRAIAQSSNEMSDWNEQSNTMAEKVLSCGWLEIPSSIKQEPISYVVGSQVTVTGCRYGYQLEGTTKTYTCMESSSDPDVAYWDPSTGVECIYTGGGLTDMMIAVISVPSIIVGILIIVAIVFLCIWCNKRRKKKELERKRKYADQEEFQDVDVIGFGKNTNMFYNPNNPAVTGIGQPVRHEHPSNTMSSTTTTKSKLPPSTAPSTSSSSTPKKIAPPPSHTNTDTLMKQSSGSEDFFDKESVDGPFAKPPMDTVLLPSTLEKPKKKHTKKKKKPAEELQPPPEVIERPSERPSERGGRPRRPEMKPYVPIAPPSDTPVATPTHTPPVVPNPMPYAYDPSLQYSDTSSVGLQSAVSQQELENMYRQQGAETQFLNEQNRPARNNKSRPYRYPTAQRR